MTRKDAIWITGVGCVSALGDSFDQFTDNILAGRSGVAPVRRFNVPNHQCKIASCLPDIQVPTGWDGADFSQRDLWEQLILRCAVTSLQSAGLWGDRSALRVGMVVGIGAEWPARWEQDQRAGGRLIATPDEDPGLVQTLHKEMRLSGPTSTVAAACASGNIALGIARQWLRNGWVDVCLAGGCENSVTPLSLACFGNMGALSRRNDDPAGASRPFDRSRDGFVLGEGGALLVLEREADARRRRAPAYGEIAGFGATSDAFHLVIPSSDALPASRAIQTALDDARINPDEVDYVNAHATSTPVGDTFETRGLLRVFGARAGAVPVSSTKSMTGHLLSAASAIEAVVCLGALARQAVPPTINLSEIDPECAALCHVPHVAREHRIDTVISNSFGFGGSNTCLVLRRVA